MNDGILTLIAADGGTRDLDPDLVGDLQLHGFLVHLRDLAVDSARGHDVLTDFEAGLEVLHLLLLALRGQQHDEIEDAEDDREEDELRQRVWGHKSNRA